METSLLSVLSATADIFLSEVDASKEYCVSFAVEGIYPTNEAALEVKLTCKADGATVTNLTYFCLDITDLTMLVEHMRNALKSLWASVDNRRRVCNT